MQHSLIEHEKTIYFGGLLALLLAVALCLWVLAKLFWQLFPVTDQNDIQVNSSANSATHINSVAGDLAKLHLFGESGQAITIPVGFNAPETTLDLKLYGTFAVDEDPQSGFAIIGDSAGNEGHFSAGDDIPGNAKLREIHPDRVILMRAGQFETLKLRPETENQTTSNFRTRKHRQPIAQRSNPGSAIRSNQSSALPAINAIDMQAAQQFRLNPTELAKQVTARAHMQNGRQIGIRLEAGRNAELLKSFGIRRTDVITSVNGIAMDNPIAGMSLIPKLQSESTLTVTILRDGSEITQNIELNQ